MNGGYLISELAPSFLSELAPSLSNQVPSLSSHMMPSSEPFKPSSEPFEPYDDDDDKLYLTTLTLSAKAGFHNGRVKY